MRKGRLPDAIVIEHPRYAGGHLGATRIEELGDPRFDFETVLPEARAFFASSGSRRRDSADPRRRHQLATSACASCSALGAGGGADRHAPSRSPRNATPHPNFKRGAGRRRPGGHRRVHERRRAAGARGADAVAAQATSARSRARPQPARTKRALREAFDCLIACGLRDGIGRVGPVLHRPPARGRAARRRQERAVLPRRGRCRSAPEIRRWASCSTTC